MTPEQRAESLRQARSTRGEPDIRVLRIGRFSRRFSTRGLLSAAGLGTLTVLLVLLALCLGDRPLSAQQVLEALLPEADRLDRMVVWQWRAPRALGAAIFGAFLGISGAVFQALTRNSLGSPDVIGLTTGAYSGVLVVLVAGGTGTLALASGAVVGGLLTALTVYLLAYRNGLQGFRLIVVGIAVGAMLTALNTWFSVSSDLSVALRAAVWGAGTLATVQWSSLLVAAGIGAVFLLLVPPIARGLRQLALGEDTAQMTGARPERVKILAVIAGIGLVAAVTAISGPIPFIALAAPHIARRLRRAGFFDPLGSAAVGAVLLTGADLLAQHAWSQAVLPVGVVAVLIGGAYLLWVLFRERGRG